MADWYVDEALGTDDLSHGTGPGVDAFKSLHYAVVESGLPDDGDTVNVAAGTYNPEAPIAVIKSLVNLGDIIAPSNVVVNAPLTEGLYDRDCFQVLANDVTIQGHKLVGAMDDKPDHNPAWGQLGRQNAGIMVGSDVTLTTHGVLKGVSGGKFNYNEIVDGSKGMFLYHAKDCEVSHNTVSTTRGKDPDNFYDILAWNGDGIHVYLESPSDYPTGNIITFNTMDNVRVGVFLNGDSIAGIDPTAWDFRGTIIEENVLTNVWNAGIILQCASGVDGSPIIIRLNEIDTSTGRRSGDEGNERGLISVHGDYVDIIENILTGSEEHGIWADGHHLTIVLNTSTLHTKDGIIIGAYKKVEPNNGWTLPEITRDDIVADHNIIQECRVGVKICDGSNTDIRVLRNRIENCLAAGVWFQDALIDLKVVGNSIRNNPVGVACDIEGEKASDVRIHLNRIEGNTVGVKNDYQAEPQEIDARFNWWGSADGPGGVADGHGDPVTERVLFEPFLTAPPVHGSCGIEVVSGESAVLSNPDAGVVLEGSDLQYASQGVLGCAKLDGTPVTSIPLQQATGLAPVKFVDVFGTGLAGGRVKITVSCAEELHAGVDAKTLELYMWYEEAWHLGEDTGVDFLAKTVWGTFNAVDLNGAPGAVGGATADYESKGSLATTVVVSRLPDQSGNLICDGVADDIEINNALAYVNALGGGRVVLKQGTYTLADPIVFPGNNIWLRGMGRSTFIDGDALTTTNHAIELVGRTGCTIKKLAIQTEDGGGKSSHCFFIDDGCNHLTIEDVHIVDSDSDGVHIEGTNVTDIHIHGLRIDGADDNGISVNMDGGNFCDRLMIDKCVFYGAGAMGIHLLECRYAEIISNVIVASLQSGIIIDDDCIYCNISNCVCVLNTQHGIVLATTATHISVEGCVAALNTRHGIYLNGVFDSLVADCLCQGNDAGDTGTYDGIYLDTTSERNDVIGNHCCENDRYGIAVEDKQNNVIGNQVHTNNQHGIYISGAECKITGNYVTDNSQDTAGTYHGIVLVATANRCQVSDNYCSDTGGDTQSDGIYLTAGAVEVMINNNYCYNGFANVGAGNGITLAGDNLDCQIVGNHCNQNDGDGIYVFNESDRCVVTGNKCMENGANGILISESDYCAVTGNTCSANGADGIHVAGDDTHEANYNSLTGNTSTGNTGAGIELSEVGAGDCTKTIVIGNQLLGNAAALTDGGTNTEIGHNITV